MMHQLLGRLAQFGGEGALGVLFALSIVNLGIISQRVWFFIRHRISASAFVKQLVPLLRARDLLRAEALSQHSPASICSVSLAGLMQAETGLSSIEQAMNAAISHERVQLADKLVLLKELAQLSLFVGILGSLFDVLAWGSANPSGSPNVALIAAITPIVAGLLVAIPAWLTRSMLNVHVQRVLGECEFVARLVSSQLALAAATTSTSSTQPLPAHRVAA